MFLGQLDSNVSVEDITRRPNGKHALSKELLGDDPAGSGRRHGFGSEPTLNCVQQQSRITELARDTKVDENGTSSVARSNKHFGSRELHVLAVTCLFPGMSEP